MEKQRQAHQQQQQKVALYSQALALMGRIYVGSINFDVFEDQIRSVFGIYGPIKVLFCRNQI
jgi:poly(U)-binding-splicing factor PUF60